MSPIAGLKGTIVILCGLIFITAGCSRQNSNSSVNPDTGKHNIANWSNPDVHGEWAKRPVTENGFASCQDCHGSDFAGGNSQRTCMNTAGCHGAGVNAPHPAAWAGGTRTHQTTDQSNAPVCAGCHTNGANSPIALPTPAPAGTAPGCFNNTLCHGAGHPAGWNSPDQHGASAKSQASGFSGCKTCHGPNFSGSGSAPTCLNTAACHGATVTAPHSPAPWRGGTRTHTNTNEGNAAACADCHTGGANLTSIPAPPTPPAGTPAGCFNNTLCHAQIGHAAGWANPGTHGAAANSAPSATAMQGFTSCQACRGANFAGGTATTCLNTAGCHGTGVNSPHARAPWISSAMTHTSTNTANATICGGCHEGETGNGNHPYTTPGPVGCFDSTLCHAAKASTCVGCHVSPQGTRDAVVGEFGLAWGHKKTGRGAVTDADCIVCHLEGSSATQTRSAYHGDGNIDLRDPDGAGETPITNITSGAFTFTKFATSYAAGSRTTTGHTSNSVDNVLTQKFCLACHDNNGATNTTARTSGGTAFMPWGGVNLGANYTVANGAASAGGVINVKAQFATTNSSIHPVLGPRSSDYPVNTRLAVPYNNIGTTRVAGAHNLANSVVLNCFDCHNTPTAPLTDRTVVAHGNAVTLRGTIYANGAASTLCTTCHTGYTSAPGTAGVHGAGSAWAATGSSHDVRIDCHGCHGSNISTARAVRPLGAQDYHGNNALVGGGLWPTINSRPYAFIRGWTGGAYYRPYRSSEFTTGNATCGAGTCPTDGQVGDGSTRTYTPGGTY